MKNMNVNENRNIGLKERLASWVGGFLGRMAVDTELCWFWPVYEPETPSDILEEIVNLNDRK